MIRTCECEQVIKNPNTGRTYLFAGTFGFIRTLGLAQRDPALIHNDLMDGLLPPEEIKDAIKFSLEKIDGIDVADADKEKEAVEFIEEAGLIDSSIVARIVMSHAMNGAIKKKTDRESGAGEGNSGDDNSADPFPLDDLHSTWVVLGGEYFGFDRASMYDFQRLLDAHKKRYGIEEDAIQTVDDLNALYAKIDVTKL